MKNIIKRGTSLLLVLAMLLSFAAVVGAEEPTTTTSEKILTLTVEDAVVKAGETTYIPAYVQGSTDNIIMSMNLSAISENSAVFRRAHAEALRQIVRLVEQPPRCGRPCSDFPCESRAARTSPRASGCRAA